MTSIKAGKQKKESLDDFRILRCENLPKHFNQDMAFNLFSQYGEILALKLIESSEEENSRIIYIEYSSNEGLKNARKYLQGITIDNLDLMFSLTKYVTMAEIVDFERKWKGDLHMYTLDSSLQRNIKANPKLSYPSQFLNVSNLTKTTLIKFTKIMAQKLNLDEIKNCFNKNGTHFFEFKDKNSSSKILTEMNNVEFVEGVNCQISFISETKFRKSFTDRSKID